MQVVLNVVVFNYMERPIFDIQVDGKVNAASGAYPFTGKSNTVGVKFMLGPKIVTWKLDGPQNTPRNGETVRSRNKLELNDVVGGAKYLSVHIYQDETVDLMTSVYFPQISPRQLESSKMDKSHAR